MIRSSFLFVCACRQSFVLFLHRTFTYVSLLQAILHLNCCPTPAIILHPALQCLPHCTDILHCANPLPAQWTHPAVWRCYECSEVDGRLWMHGPEPELAWHLVAFPCIASTDKARHCVVYSVPSSPSTPVTLTTTFCTGISQRTEKKSPLLINSESVSSHRAKPAYMSDYLDNAHTLLGFSYQRLKKEESVRYLDGLTF